MARCALQVARLAAALSAAAVAGQGAGPAAAIPPAAASASRGLPAAAPTTPADVAATHQRQRQLCLPLAVAAVRAECLRQADRSRDQALAAIQPPAAAASGPPARGASR